MRNSPIEAPAHRDENIVIMYATGQTLEQIGQHYGISRERVRQIIEKYTTTEALRATRLYGFKEMDPTDYHYRYAWSSKPISVWKAHHRNKARRREDIALVCAWKERTGRNNPSLFELRDILKDNSVTTMYLRWGRIRGNPRYGKNIYRLRRLTGLVTRPTGENGHLGPRRKYRGKAKVG